MYQVNLSKDSDYHTQINNKKIPYASCNTTAMVMALKAAGLMFDFPAGVQPEDHFTEFMHRGEAFDKMHQWFPYAEANSMLPQNFSKCLEWGINEMMGRRVDKFTTRGTLQEMIWHVSEGRPLVMSGKFTSSGHFVTLVGFRTLQHKQDLRLVEGVILEAVDYVTVDDPYGNFHVNYTSHKGNDIKFDLDAYDKLTNIPGKGKWMHIIGDRHDVI